MAQTRRFLGGRQPLCGIGVTSRIERICRPAVASAWIADSRPDPGPCTRTCTRRMPRFSASRAACSAATVAANGVDFFEPENPAFPEEPQAIVFPCMSVIVMSVLLNVAVMWAMPSASTTFLARLAPVGFACAIYFLSRGFFLPAIARRGPFLVRAFVWRSEEHTSELQSRLHLVCRLLLEKKKMAQEAHLHVVRVLCGHRLQW